MRRGQIYWVHRPEDDPKSYRCFVVVSWQILIDSKVFQPGLRANLH